MVLRTVMLGQGMYYVATGAWPLIDIETFERVTGPKTDRWLVKTVGALITVVGATLLVACQRAHPSPEAAVLSVGTAAAMALVDVIYPAKGRISPVYLLDAVPELAVVGSWAAEAARRGLAPAAVADPAEPWLEHG